MTNILNKSNNEKILLICNNIVHDTYQFNDIVAYMNEIDSVVRDITSDQKLINISILINDDLSEVLREQNLENKSDVIKEIWEFYKEDVKYLAFELKKQLKINLQKYYEKAIQNHYCSELIEETYGKNE